MYEKEEDMELPEGAESMQVKQKTITDSKGVISVVCDGRGKRSS